jgi:hypothetical protein
MTNINFDSTQIEESFTRLYESGKFTYEQFDEQSKRLFEITNQMKQKEEETKQKEEETKQKEEETKQIASTNIAKNIENLSSAAIKWSDTLAPIFTTVLLLFEGGREIYNQMSKKPKENTDDNTK